MRASLERALLMAAGLALILYSINGPVSEAIKSLDEKRSINCVNTATKSIDLAIANSLGGGYSDTYVYLPCKVVFSCSGYSVKVSSGNTSASLRYPFEVRCRGEAVGFGRFVSVWREQYVSLGWAGAWRRD